LASTATILGYYLYNRYLEQTYGAAFLGVLLPPDSLSQSIEISKTVYHNWFFHYFTGYHYAVLAILAIAMLYFYLIKRSKSTINSKLLLIYICITFIGFCCYYIAMMQQFPQHDYYFLDSFYAVICLLLIFLVSYIRVDLRILNILGVLGILLFMVVLFTTNRMLQNRREETGFWDRVEITTNSFKDADRLLRESSIPTNARILVIDSYTANIPFIKMNRFGYAMMSKKSEDIKKSLTWNYDYIVMQDCYTLSDVIVSYPQIMNELERIGGNGRISIYKRQPSTKTRNGFEFLQIDSKKPHLSKRIDFDATPDSCWQNIYSRSIPGSIYNVSGVLTDSIPFSTTLSLRNCPFLVGQDNLVTMEIDILSTEILNNSYLTVSVDEDGISRYFSTFELEGLAISKSTWNHIQLVFPVLPQLKLSRNELKAFIWNDGKHRVFYDNFSIVIQGH